MYVLVRLSYVMLSNIRRTSSEHSIICWVVAWASPRFGMGGGQNLFSDLGLCEAMRIARGFGGMLSRKKIKTMQFGAF